MATATFTTVVDRSVGDPLTEAIWDDQLKDNINALAGAHNNLLTNGGFEIWQRGAGAFTANAAYTADRWYITDTGTSSISVTRESTTIDASGQYSLAAAMTYGGADSCNISQKVENHLDLRGREVSFSIRIRQGAASAALVRIIDSAGSASASLSSTTGSFVTFSVTKTIDAAATSLTVDIGFTASATFYLDNAMLVIGPAPAPYRPLHPQEDLARCQRYYEVLGGVANTMLLEGYGAAANPIGMTVFFKVTKGGTPTVTKNGTWGTSNCAQPGVGAPSVGSCYMDSAVTALGAAYFNATGSTTTVTAEYNP